MAIIQISKIMVRSGNLSDIPQLDSGEMGFAQDQRRLFIGNEANRPGDPDPNNTEILTQYSPIDGINIRGSVAAPGSDSQIIYNSNGVFAATSAIIIEPDLANSRSEVVVSNANVVIETSSNITMAVDYLYVLPQSTGNTQQEGFSLTLANAGTGAVSWSNVYPNSALANNGDVLTIDGANGTLRWSPANAVGGNGNGSPGGSLGQIQYLIDSNTFGGAGGFVFSGGNLANNTPTTLTIAPGNTLVINGILSVPGNAQFTGANISLGDLGNLKISNASNRYFLQADGTAGNLIWGLPTQLANGSSNLMIDANAAVRISSQGNANAFVVSGPNSNVNGNLTVSANITANNFTANGIFLFQGNLANLGNVSNLRIVGGINGQVLTTNGLGGLSWASVGNATSLVNGNSNIIVAANGNITISSAGVANIITVTNNTVSVANSVSIIIGNGNIVANTSANISLGAVSNLHITGGTANQFLQTDGNGNLSWANAASGSDYSNANVANYLPAYTGNISAGNIAVTGNISSSNINVSAQLTSNTITVSGNLQAGNLNTTGSLVAANITGTLTTAAQPNITSVGTLTSLSVNGTATISQILGNGTVDFANATSVFLGPAAVVKITGGSANQYLQTDGNGNLSWATPTASLANGTSAISIPVSAGNIDMTVGGNTIMTVSNTGVTINSGNLTTTGTGVSTITSGSDINLQTGSGTGAVNVIGNVAITNRLQLSNAALLSTSSNANVTNKLAIDIGGTTYYILLSTSSS